MTDSSNTLSIPADSKSFKLCLQLLPVGEPSKQSYLNAMAVTKGRLMSAGSHFLIFFTWSKYRQKDAEPVVDW